MALVSAASAGCSPSSRCCWRSPPVRALQLATVNAGRLSSLANAEHVATITLPAPRGSIIDRNGDLLAVDEAADDIIGDAEAGARPRGRGARSWPRCWACPSRSSRPTSPTRSPPTGRAWPARCRPRPPQQVLKLGIPGIALTPDARRVYPGDTLAAQVLGGVGWNGGGLSGVELRVQQGSSPASPGTRRSSTTARASRSTSAGPAAVAGKTVQLTIDAPLQQYTDSVVAQTGEAFQALHATAIVLDPRTGAIYAMSSWPRVSANDSAAVGLAENYADQLIYEPGSTFKVVAIGGALSDGIISPDTTFTIPPCIQVANYCITDSETHRHGAAQHQADPRPARATSARSRSARSSATSSSTTGFAASASARRPASICPARSRASCRRSRAGRARRSATCRSARACRSRRCRSPPPTRRSPTAACCARPTSSRASAASPVAVPKGHRILTPTVAAQLRGMLEGVLGPSGTASEISIPGYSLAGKTGTANKVVDGTYSHKDYVASFVGFAPASGPPARGDRRRRPAAGIRDLRHRGRRAGLAEDHGLRAALPEDRPRLSRPRGPAFVRPPRRASYTAPACCSRS